jgi:hypothetical protein
MPTPLAKHAGVFSTLAVSHAAAPSAAPTMAGRLKAAPAVSHAPEAFAQTVAHPSMAGRGAPAAGGGWGDWTVGDARARNAMIRSLRGALTTRAFRGGALKRFGDLAHADPVRALTRVHAADQGLRGALYGGLIGGAGGALLSRPGDEEGMALRGALAGALGGGGYGAYAGHRDASNYLATPEGLKALAGRLSALRQSGRHLSHAFTA